MREDDKRLGNNPLAIPVDKLLETLWAEEMATHNALQRAAKAWKCVYYFVDGKLCQSFADPSGY